MSLRSQREALRRATAPTLVRLSQLARFWELNTETLMTWIRQGRLASIRSPGGHHRVRVAEVRAFCEREGRPVPPFVDPPPRRVVSGVSLPRGLRLPAAVLEPHAEPYGALLASATGGAAVLVLPASAARFDAEAAILALRRAPATASLQVVVVGAPTHPRVEALQRAGATVVLSRSRADDLPRVLRELLGLE